jgi:hypothetical protein
MKLKLLKNSVTGEIKKQFNSEYPFLKLEFLILRRMQTGGRHPLIADDNTRLGILQPAMKEGGFLVSDSTTVDELERLFKDHLLSVQVFRLSENLWLETTITDSWTLKKQNNHGKEISEFRYSSNPGSSNS